MTRADAGELIHRHRVPIARDFHTLTASEVDRVLEAADSWGYRKPRAANGSRARYFHAYLARVHARAD